MKKTILIIAMLLNSLEVNAADITVLFNDAMEFRVSKFVKGYTLESYNVDGLERGISAIRGSLTKDETESAKIARDLMPAYKEDIEKGGRGLAIIQAWEIEKLPAIIFGKGEYVYYGKDINKAIELWEKRK